MEAVKCFSQVTPEMFNDFSVKFFKYSKKSKIKSAVRLLIIRISLLLGNVILVKKSIENIFILSDPQLSESLFELLVARPIDSIFVIVGALVVLWTFANIILNTVFLYEYYFAGSAVRRSMKNEGNFLIENGIFILTEKYVKSLTSEGEIEYYWSAITKIVYSQELIVFLSGFYPMIIVSRRSLESDQLLIINKIISKQYTGEFIELD